MVLVLAISAALPAYADADVGDINLPDGFNIEVWVDDVPNARSLALGDDGTVFVATRRDGRIYAVVTEADGQRTTTTLASKLKMPNGIAFHDGDLYVAENHRILRYPDIEQRLTDVPQAVVVVDDLPTESHHGWRYIDFGPDGKLYISIGAPCNVCERQGFANITRMNPDGSEREIIAYGIRNSVGFTWHPDTGRLWFTDNGRDMLGDDLPPGELNQVTSTGQHFGFPYCHAGEIPDPDFGKKRDCAEFVAPELKLGPHVAPLGMLFYSGDMFPQEYYGSVFIAEHGSWNRSRKIGYRVTTAAMRDGHPQSYGVFADGWLQGEDVSGRPVDLLMLRDGSILISDNQSGAIYRVSYSRPLDDGVAP